MTAYFGLTTLLLLVVAPVVFCSEIIPEVKSETILSRDLIINSVNANPNAGWKAGVNQDYSDYTNAQFKRILGGRPTPKSLKRTIPVVRHDKSLELPKEFDARKAWPHCSSISRILDQGHCGSCWAFAGVEPLTDRFCIKYNSNISLSVNDLLACCGSSCGDGCHGGLPINAWRYFVDEGIVTEECDPYFDTEGCTHPGCKPIYPTPKCVKKCVAGDKLWKESKHYASNAYRIERDPQQIMSELYKNGPLAMGFTVYEDFRHYKSGVYKHVEGGYIDGHAVKLIGWGISEDGEDYWLLANQWNRSWGDDGYFKILRGTNECGIEGDVTAGLPSSKNLAY